MSRQVPLSEDEHGVPARAERPRVAKPYLIERKWARRDSWRVCGRYPTAAIRDESLKAKRRGTYPRFAHYRAVDP